MVDSSASHSSGGWRSCGFGGPWCRRFRSTSTTGAEKSLGEAVAAAKRQQVLHGDRALGRFDVVQRAGRVAQHHRRRELG